MRFKYHLFFGLIFTAILYFIFSPIVSFFGLLIIFLSSFLIDVDHYLYYVFRKKDISLKRAYKWYIKYSCKFCHIPLKIRKNYYLGFYIFHGIEPLITLFLLGFYVSPIFTFILIGFFFHLSTDLVAEIILGQRIDKVSVIQNFISTRKLKNFEEVEEA